jgi:hypothetical protein
LAYHYVIDGMKTVTDQNQTTCNKKIVDGFLEAVYLERKNCHLF